MTTISVKSFLIVCPLVFIAGLIDAIAGGGGLITLPAYLLTGLPPHNAIATNKLSSAMGTTVAFGKYAREGYIKWKIAVICILFSIAGSTAGANIALRLSDSAFKIIMLCITPLCAFYVLKKKNFDEGTERQVPNTKLYLICAAIAFFMGGYDGFYGPGTGTFLLILLTGLAGMKLTEANGITKAINLASNYSALAVYLINRKAIIPLGLTAGLFSIAGNYIGSKLFSTKGSKIARPVMITVLILFVIKLVSDLVGTGQV